MREVKFIPAPEPRQVPRDPWLDKLLDGKLRKLDTAAWSSRYKSARSAQSAIRQAAQHRGLTVTVAIRDNAERTGKDVYVQSSVPAPANGTKPKRARKAAAKPES